MPVLFNYLKIPNCFIGLNADFAKIVELCTTETFRNRFFDSNQQRKIPIVIRHLLSSP